MSALKTRLARRHARPHPGERAAAGRFRAAGRSPRRCCGATRAGTLATLDRNSGHPFASLVNVATDRRRLAADPGVAARHSHRQSGGRRPRLAAACRDRQRRRSGASAADRARHFPRGGARGRRRARDCAAASWRAIRNPSSTPASPISRSGAWMLSPRISTAALPAPPISTAADCSPILPMPRN